MQGPHAGDAGAACRGCRVRMQGPQAVGAWPHAGAACWGCMQGWHAGAACRGRMEGPQAGDAGAARGFHMKKHQDHGDVFFSAWYHSLLF